MYWKDFILKKVRPYRYPYRLLERSPQWSPSVQGTSVVVFATHPDDESIGVGITMARHVRAGEQVVVVIVSDGHLSPNTKAPAEVAKTRVQETYRALEHIGVGKDNIIFLGFPDSKLYYYGVEISADVYRLLKHFRASRVYVHSLEGGHIDHDIVSFIVQNQCDALNISEMYEWAEYSRAYPMEGNDLDFEDESGTATKVILSLEERALKTAMLQEYRSQGVEPFFRNKPEVVRRACPRLQFDRLNKHYLVKPFWKVRLDYLVSGVVRSWETI